MLHLSYTSPQHKSAINGAILALIVRFKSEAQTAQVNVAIFFLSCNDSLIQA